MIRNWLGTALVLCLLAVSQGTAAYAQTLVLRGGTVYASPEAQPISDAFNLGAVSLRLGGRRLAFDAAAGKVTNSVEANEYLTREYRKGWELS